MEKITAGGENFEKSCFSRVNWSKLISDGREAAEKDRATCDFRGPKSGRKLGPHEKKTMATWISESQKVPVNSTSILTPLKGGVVIYNSQVTELCRLRCSDPS